MTSREDFDKNYIFDEVSFDVLIPSQDILSRKQSVGMRVRSQPSMVLHQRFDRRKKKKK
jgi:hypothetical protein